MHIKRKETDLICGLNFKLAQLYMKTKGEFFSNLMFRTKTEFNCSTFVSSVSLIMKVTKVTPFQQSNVRNLAWSMKPLVLWMRFIGIDFGHYDASLLKLSKGLKSKMFNVLASLLLIVNLFIQILSISFLHYESGPSLTDSSPTLRVNHFIHKINYCTRNISGHLCLLLIVRRRWRKIWKAMKQMEPFMTMNEPGVYLNLRKFAVFGTVYILVMVNRRTANQFNFILN